MHCTCSQREWKLCLFNFSVQYLIFWWKLKPHISWLDRVINCTNVICNYHFFTCIGVIKLYVDCGNVVINYQCFKIPVYLFISLSWTSGLSVSVIGGSLLAWYSTHLVSYYCGFKMGHSRRNIKILFGIVNLFIIFESWS